MNTFTIMKKRIEILERIDTLLDDIERDASMEYVVIKETQTHKQQTSWRTGELLWEDDEHTIPKYVIDKEYGYVAKSTLDVDDKITIDCVNEIRKSLVEMVK